VIAIGRSARRRRIVALTAATGALLLLTGCGGAIKAGSAATVGDDTLSESAVSDIADEVNAIAAAGEIDQALPAGEVYLRIVALWVDMEITEALAEAEDVTVTDAEIDAFIAQFDDAQLAQIAAGSAIPTSQLERAARTVLLQQKLPTELAPGANPAAQKRALSAAKTETAAELGVSVNPRYGSWDPVGVFKTGPGVKSRDTHRLSEPAVTEPVHPVAPPTP
jgi:hypothetical protein